MGNAESCVGDCGGDVGGERRDAPAELAHRPMAPLKPIGEDGDDDEEEPPPCVTFFPSGISTRIMHDHEREPNTHPEWDWPKREGRVQRGRLQSHTRARAR